MANPYSSTPGNPGTSGTPHGSSLMPRRSSYASVVSGGTSAASQNHQPPTRSGAFAHLLSNYEPQFFGNNDQNLFANSRFDSRASDLDVSTNGGSYSRVGGRGAPLPSFSSAFGALAGYGTNDGSHAESFFVPSYLRGSKYVQALEEAHKAKVEKQGTSAPASQSGSLSTSASSLNPLAKIAPSHRGMTYDLIEKIPPIEEQTLPPLPTKWNTHDKNPGLEVLSDGLEVKFAGTKPAVERDHEACAIRADHPMPSQCGIYYYEVSIMSRKREDSSIGVGFSGKRVTLNRLPGWEPESWAYHGDDGHSFCCQSSGKHYGPPFTAGDTIGCGVNFRTGSAFFTKNGVHLGVAFREIKGEIYPSIGMKKAGEQLKVNFGQTPFMFDIDSVMSTEKNNIRRQITETSTAALAPPLKETELIQSLVLQFLTHDGYVESARAFAEELQTEKNALNLDPESVIDGINVKEDEDARHRQRIRAYILDGQIEEAHSYTENTYPKVLLSNEGVYFRLRCRRFIEMIKRGGDIQHSQTSTISGKKSNGYHGDYYDDAINHDMELDDHQTHNQWDKMDTEDTPSLDYSQLLQQTLDFGKELQAEFRDDPRREVKKALEDAFALMAYPDPRQAKLVAHLLDPNERVALAEEINSAILHSLGRSSSAALEKLIQQTDVLLTDLREHGGPGSFVNLNDYVKPLSQRE